MLRTAGGIIAGIIVALVTIMAVQLVGSQIYPTAEIDLRDSEAVGAMIASMPIGALLFVVLAWISGAFAGGWTAARISGRRWAAWLIGGLVALSGIANILLYPHPDWMQVSAVIAPVIGGILAGHVFGRRTAPVRDASA